MVAAVMQKRRGTMPRTACEVDRDEAALANVEAEAAVMVVVMMVMMVMVKTDTGRGHDADIAVMVVMMMVMIEYLRQLNRLLLGGAARHLRVLGF